MERALCCNIVGVRRGAWTPEEDNMLVSYIQQHGPANWKAVATNSGLRRCHKSCWNRWTNDLRRGVKSVNFTDEEENTIILLQALLGYKWAAITSFLPGREDYDIEYYWNTHLKKKKQRYLQEGQNSHSTHGLVFLRGQWETRLKNDIEMAKKALLVALSLNKKPSFVPSDSKPLPSSNIYPSNTENIARLLKGWNEKSPKQALTDIPISQSSSSVYTSNMENIARLLKLKVWMKLTPKQAPTDVPSQSSSSVYASNMENIARLLKLKGWMKLETPKQATTDSSLFSTVQEISIPSATNNDSGNYLSETSETLQYWSESLEYPSDLLIDDELLG